MRGHRLARDLAFAPRANVICGIVGDVLTVVLT